MDVSLVFYCAEDEVSNTKVDVNCGSSSRIPELAANVMK